MSARRLAALPDIRGTPGLVKSDRQAGPCLDAIDDHSCATHSVAKEDIAFAHLRLSDL